MTEAEAALAQAETDLDGLRGQLSQGEAHVAELEADLAAPSARLSRAADDVAGLKAAVAAVPAAESHTPVAFPPAKGRGVADEARRLHQELDAAQAAYDRAATDLDQARRQADAAREALAAPREATEAKAHEVEQRRNVLDALRQKGTEDGDATWGAAALSSAAGPVQPSARAVAEIPADYLDLYRRAAQTCPGLSWTVLAGIGSVETAHGRATAPGVRSGTNEAGAMGPMQFLAPTWATYGTDGGGDGAVDVYDPADAIFGAARYLCATGAGRLATLADAIWAYNHADWYVEQVLVLAGAYGAAPPASMLPGDLPALVAAPNLTLTSDARSDLLSGTVDPRLVGILATAVTSHHIGVSVIRTGHDQFVKGTTRVSNHYYGRAVDIAEVDGAPVSAANDAALALAVELLSIDGPLRPEEVGSPWPELSRFAGAFSDEDHLDHLHLGWSTEPAGVPQVTAPPTPPATVPPKPPSTEPAAVPQSDGREHVWNWAELQQWARETGLVGQ